MKGLQKASWKNVLLVVISSAIALFLAEVSVGIFYPQNLGTWGMTRDGLTSHTPNISIYLNQFQQQITINSHGMRDREHDLQKPPGISRILVLGDSFMEANQVPLDESFTRLLEGHLGRSVEVINGSVSGWGTDDELAYLIRYGFQFNPDVVLVGMTLHNDLQDNLAEEFHSFKNGILEEKQREDIPLIDYAILRVKGFLASRSHLYQIALRAKRFSWIQDEGNRLSTHVASLLSREPSAEVAQGWEMMRHLMRKMKLETTRRGVRLVVFMIPLWVQISNERLEGFLTEHRLSIDQVVLDQPQARMRSIAKEEGVAVIDLLHAFQEAEQKEPGSLYLRGDGHWTATGHRLAARIVQEQLRSSILFANK